ncbi:PLP-dependent aminotransferase family protein [Deinococcus yavapaiensis]|uniref:GntR family transcriptional regulator n=1 Tax=Deinococcus yavapaiensis KR-236 TaxID=694435 RepID=A0A318SR98_9DEIO|nr:PLP-dependent aminotransferase family protein [Deinococcus yavapaiensis]PYE55453.1 GntR family transcriptional regulator [Deinococcus yavapaiensis KR-236]
MKTLDQFTKGDDAFARDVDVAVHLDRTSRVPLAHQLVCELRRAITDGRLPSGTRLPASRILARALQVSRHTVLIAYDELLSHGLLEGRVGSGTFVSEAAPRRTRGAEPASVSPPRWLRGAFVTAHVSEAARDDVIEFRAGQPEVAPVSNEAWKRAWRRVAAEALPGEYAQAAGDLALRAQLAAYLSRARGVSCSAEDVVITSGTIQGLHLVARATLRENDVVAFEEPGYRLGRQVFLERGAKVVPVPVDDDGLRVADLPGSADAPILVYTTPSHQFPLGARLALPRRAALLAWAREHDALVLEDDYDGEFRYDAPPLPALASMDRGRVAYFGTFSKVLSPSLRVGYVVAPPPLRDRIVELKTIADYHTSWPVQRALAHFLASGDLERHLRRMRRSYAKKRGVLVRALANVKSLARVRGLEAGFHVHLELDDAVDASAVAHRAAERGVSVSTLAPFYSAGEAMNGLLLGYGGLSVDRIEAGARVLVDVIREVATADGG